MEQHIKIRRAPGTWVVRAGGAVLGETSGALELSEGDFPPVIYFPPEDLAMAFLELSETISVDPFKGSAKHFAIHTKSVVIADAAWSYDEPKEATEALRGYIAFYPTKAAVEQL
ncbi:DUF427 domain-containing protein [Celeribacter indicus]|uniref:DUF427 domain-containing protein n=1 Tax=Celeribacter indicus TaxID=1208324 RepID=UPI0005C32E84|nr:DUF427 domain-containing protein [Celeribacter indicus]